MTKWRINSEKCPKVGARRLFWTIFDIFGNFSTFCHGSLFWAVQCFVRCKASGRCGKTTLKLAVPLSPRGLQRLSFLLAHLVQETVLEVAGPQPDGILILLFASWRCSPNHLGIFSTFITGEHWIGPTSQGSEKKKKHSPRQAKTRFWLTFCYVLLEERIPNSSLISEENEFPHQLVRIVGLFTTSECANALYITN